MDHAPYPMWVLLAHNLDDDTLVVICHWHREPSQDEIVDMIKNVPALGRFTFPIAKIG